MPPMSRRFPTWMRNALLIAAGVHVAVGFALLVEPSLLTRMGWAAEGESFAIRLLGGVDAAIGFGFAVASMAPLRYWPVVLVGFLENVFPLAAASFSGAWFAAAISGAWLLPLALILARSSKDFVEEVDAPPADPRERAMLKAMSQDGYSLFELSQLRPTLLVFLRHAGCTFCREALSDLARLRPEIERAGSGVAFVTMSLEPEAQAFFERYGMGDAPRISDPECKLYRAFELRRGGWRDMFGWKVWKRGLEAGLLQGHGVGPVEGDSFRMPGVFLIHEGKVVRGFRHDGPADRPDYLKLADCKDCLKPAQAA